MGMAERNAEVRNVHAELKFIPTAFCILDFCISLILSSDLDPLTPALAAEEAAVVTHEQVGFDPLELMSELPR